MRAIFLIALRNLIYRPGRSISCSLGIALGLAIVMAVLIVDHNTLITPASLNPQPYGEPDIEIKPLRPQPDPEKILLQKSWLEDRDSLSDLSSLFFDDCSVRTISGIVEELTLCAMDKRAAGGFDAYRIDEGGDLDFHGPPTVLLSRRAAQKLNVELGDVIRIWLSIPMRRICQDGKLINKLRRDAKRSPLILDFKVSGILTETNLGLRNIAIVSFSRGLELLNGGYVLPIFWAKIAPGFDLDYVQAEMKDKFSVSKPFKRALVGQSMEEKAFRNGVRVCALLSLLLGLYIIFNSMSISLVERIRQIGLLRAMGLTRRGLAALFLGEGVLLSLMGCIISVGLTAAIVYYMQDKKITTLGFGRPLEILEIPYGQLAVIMALGVFFSLLGVVYPLGKASSLSVIQAIRKGVVEYERRPFKGVGLVLFCIFVVSIILAYLALPSMLSGRLLELFLLIVYMSAGVALVIGLLLLFPALLHFCTFAVLAPMRRLFHVTGRLAQSSLQTARLRVFSTVSGLALVFAALYLISSITDSLMSETETWSDQNLLRTVIVRTDVRGGEKEKALRKMEGVQGVLNLSARIRCPFHVRGVDPNALLDYGPLEGRTDLAPRLEEEKWIIISNRLAQTYGYEVGQAVKLSTPEADLQAFKILMISDAYGFYPDDRSFAVISEAKMDSYFCVTAKSGDRWSLHLEDGVQPERVKEQLESRFGSHASITLGRDLKEEYLEDLSANFSIFKVISVLVMLLAGLSILNSLVIAVVERRRETALFRVVGLTPGQLKGILLMEATGLGFLGGLFGLLLGIPLTCITVESIKKISYLDLAMSFNTGTILATLLGSMAVSVAASIYPMLRQSATDLMEAVKYE